MLLLGLLTGLAIATGSFATPVDAVNYWNAGSSPNPYPVSWSEVRDGLLFYPPPVVQVMTLVQPIGWAVFVTILMVATFASFWYCAREWSLPLVLAGAAYYATGAAVLQPASTFLEYALLGNLQWILAALVLLAIRRPELWSVLLLTKVTSAIGWWWHPLRGEWRAAAVGAVWSLALVAASFALAPHLWFDFAGFVARNYTMANPPIPAFPVPVGVRLVTAFFLVAWGARTNRVWTVSVATGWALPALWGLGFLPFLVAPARETFGAWRTRRRTRALEP